MARRLRTMGLELLPSVPDLRPLIIGGSCPKSKAKRGSSTTTPVTVAATGGEMCTRLGVLLDVDERLLGLQVELRRTPDPEAVVRGLGRLPDLQAGLVDHLL